MDAIKIFDFLLNLSVTEKYPDIHINSANPPIIRNNSWNLVRIEKLVFNKNNNSYSIYNKDLEYINEENIIENTILNNDDIKKIILLIAGEHWFEKFLKNMELDSSYKYKNLDRYRVNCYIDSNWYNMALRLIPSIVPTVKDLSLGDSIVDMCKKNKWLILMTWPTWCWKSTNLAAMIDFINTNYKKHILTIEDPIEFSFINQKSLINQREIWNHTLWFNEAMKSALREDPDVIMVWEMRDPETIRSAITLAETWHLVLSTLHTNDTVQSIDRIIDVFPAIQQDQIRMQLAMSLIWVISQKLIPRIDKPWRIAAREILINNDAVRNLIITWKTHLLYWVIEVSWKYWMILMDKYLIYLYKNNIISKESLLSYARDKDGIEMLIED